MKNGFSVIKVNFRGVGKSEGTFDNGQGELSDAAATLDWIERQNIDYSQCWVSGFSFGSLICMQLIMRRPEVNNFIAVSPQPNVYDFSFLAPCPTSGQVIYSENDELVTKESISELDNRIKSQKSVEVIFSKIKDNFKELNSLEEYRLLEDTWKSVTVGKFSINDFLEFLPLYKSETDPNIWSYIAGIISSLSKILPVEKSDSFLNYFNKLIGPIKENLGREVRESDSMEVKELRAIVNKLIGLKIPIRAKSENAFFWPSPFCPIVKSFSALSDPT